MISICTCGINCSHDLEVFTKFLYFHNQDCDFEICFTWDNRFRDSTGSTVDSLVKRYPNFKVIEHTESQTITYLEKLLSFYERKNLFSKEFRETLSKNFDLLKTDKLLDESQFLWLSSGFLYNKAVSISGGKNLIITPCDYIYLYPLSSIDNYMNTHSVSEEFYGKPNALMFHLGNKIERGHAYRDPDLGSDLSRYFIYDEKTRERLSLEDSRFFSKIQPFIERGVSRKEFLFNYHGQHFITRKFFDKIGGFTEEWYGRAWADDKMSSLASFNFRHHWKILPNEFCFPLTLITLAKARPIYLHNGFDKKYIDSLPTLFDKEFSFDQGKTSGRLSPPLRIGV